MEIYKKWLSIAIIFILSFSLLSPAAVAEVQGFEPNELDTSSNTYNLNEHSIESNEDISQISTNALSSTTTGDSAEINLTTLNETPPSGYVTISVEKFTLGQGYAIEPTQVPFYEGEMVGQVVARLLGSGNYNDGSSEGNISYLGNVRDSESTVNIPHYIQTEIAREGSSIGGKANSEWLGQFDYTDMSGWMYTVDHKMPNVGMSEYENIDGSVIRLQFTVYGYGFDLGFGFGDGLPYIEPANKDALTAKVAEINSTSNKGEILANANVKSAYDAAYEQLTNMESSQANVDLAFARLNSALDEKYEEVVETDKTALQTTITGAEANKDSVKISTDGKDVEPTDYWVTQAELDTYVSMIQSAQQLIADETAIQEDINSKVLALNQATEAFNQTKRTGLKTEAPASSEVKLTVAPKAVALKLYDANEQEVNIGIGVEGTYKVYTATLQAGDYRYEGFDSTGKSVGGGKLTITPEPKQEYQFRQLNFKATNTNWKVGNDYTIKVGQDSPDDTSLKFGDETSNGQIPVLGLAGKTFFYSFEPNAKHNEYIALSNSITVTIAGSAQTISGAIPFSGNVSFTVPQEAELFVGRKIKHFISFEEIKPEGEAIVNANGTKTYSYKLANNGQYNYRLSQEGKLTNTGVFTANAQNAALEITKEQLDVLSPKAILNKGTYLEGNIYLNINPQNHLSLNEGDSFKLLPLRSWQALIEGINNYFFEPDFHYEIITGNDVVEIESGEPGSYATVKALKNGTAIVKVTYDALKVNGSSYIKDANDAFSAIWPENVGLFVVTVGEDTNLSTGIESNKERNVKANEKTVKNLQNGAFDADIDSVYFVESERGAYYTFTPEENSTVTILRPQLNKEQGTASYGDGTFTADEVRKNGDGSFTILLTEGRNIVKVEKNGKVAYQVMTARPIGVTIENVTNPGEPIVAGNKVKVKVDGISFPANKLSGIYNFNGQLTFTDSNNKALVGKAFQYNLTTQGNELTFTIPESHVGEYVLKDGHIAIKGFGSAIGAHRNIDPLIGANPNFTAISMESYYSVFPQITIISGKAEKADTAALQSAITDAEANKATATVSTDGKDIDPANFWVTQEELNIYVKTITAAQALIADESATQEAVDAETLALNQATVAFNDAKKAGVVEIDKTSLQTAINKADQNKDSVKISTDGKDVEPTDYWVTQAELDAYVSTIQSAQQLIVDENAIQDVIDAKILALNQATDTFNQVKKTGTKANVSTPTQQAYNTVGQYMVNTLPNPTFGSEWFILTLARGDYNVPAGYYDNYYNNVVEYVKSVDGNLHERKYTEYSRLILALTAIGKDPTNVGGYNLVEKLSDFDKVVWQGINGAYFGLIALDTWGFELLENATTTRQKLIDHILSKQLADGGFALSGTKADPDMTAMAIQALAPYQSQGAVATAINRAVTTLATIQKENGGYASWGTENAESTAQVITALASLGIDVTKDARFNKVLPNMMLFYSPTDGGFKHTLSETKANGMATEQVGYTLVAYNRLVNGKSTLYNMLDTKPAAPTPGETEQPKPSETEQLKPGETEQPKPGETVKPKPGDTEQPKPEQAYGYSSFSIVISSSEVPLAPITTEIFEGESVFDVLKRVAAENGVSLSYRTTSYGIYIDGISGLYEFDRGPESGWMYRVNGVFPPYSAALHILQPGDRVEWLYTTNLGKDVGGYIEDIEKEPGQTEKDPNKNKNQDKDKEQNKDKETQLEQEKEENKKQEDNKTVIEVDSKEGKTETTFTAEDIKQYAQNNVKTIVIQDTQGTKLEIPTSTLSSIHLTADEKIVAAVTAQAEGKQIDVNLSIETADGTTKAISTGKAYAKITLPAKDMTPNTVVLQSVNGEYKAVPHKIVDGEIIILTKTSGTFVVMEETVTFRDITQTFNKEEIEFLASRHIIKGVNADTFEPNKPITRGQFAVMISRALGLQASEENPFSDTKGQWYEQEVQALFEAGITTGKTADTFDPEANITRQQAAALMARVLAYVDFQAQPSTEANFNDANAISAEFKQYIDLLNSLNIMTGKADGTFDPYSSLTRAQMAKILKRTLNVADLM